MYPFDLVDILCWASINSLLVFTIMFIHSYWVCITHGRHWIHWLPWRLYHWNVIHLAVYLQMCLCVWGGECMYVCEYLYVCVCVIVLLKPSVNPHAGGESFVSCERPAPALPLPGSNLKSGPTAFHSLLSPPEPRSYLQTCPSMLTIHSSGTAPEHTTQHIQRRTHNVITP